MLAAVRLKLWLTLAVITTVLISSKHSAAQTNYLQNLRGKTKEQIANVTPYTLVNGVYRGPFMDSTFFFDRLGTHFRDLTAATLLRGYTPYDFASNSLTSAKTGARPTNILIIPHGYSTDSTLTVSASDTMPIWDYRNGKAILYVRGSKRLEMNRTGDFIQTDSVFVVGDANNYAAAGVTDNSVQVHNDTTATVLAARIYGGGTGARYALLQANDFTNTVYLGSTKTGTVPDGNVAWPLAIYVGGAEAARFTTGLDMGMGTIAPIGDFEIYRSQPTLILVHSDYEKTHTLLTLDSAWVGLGFNVSNRPRLTMFDAAGKYTLIDQGANTANWTFALPPNAGSSGQFLRTDGTGVSSWANVASSDSTFEKVITDTVQVKGDAQITIKNTTQIPRLNLGYGVSGSNTLISTVDTNEDLYIDPNGLGGTGVWDNLGIRTVTFGSNASGVIAIADGTAPTSSPPTSIQMYSEGGELKVRDSGGNITVVSDLVPSSAGGWSDLGTKVALTSIGDSVTIGTTTALGKLSVQGNVTTTTKFLSSLGTAGAPAFSNTSVSTAGMFFPTTNTVALAAEAIEMFRVAGFGVFTFPEMNATGSGASGFFIGSKKFLDFFTPATPNHYLDIQASATTTKTVTLVTNSDSSGARLVLRAKGTEDVSVMDTLFVANRMGVGTHAPIAHVDIYKSFAALNIFDSDIEKTGSRDSSGIALQLDAAHQPVISLIRSNATGILLKTGSGLATWTWTLPVGAGSAGQFLQTDGTGITSWATASGSGDITGVTAGSGLSGGGLSGDVTLDLNVQLASQTIEIATDSVRVKAGSLTTSHLGTSSVDTDELAPNVAVEIIQSGVTSLARNDTIKFAAGANITLTPSGNTITIAAGAGGAPSLATRDGGVLVSSTPTDYDFSGSQFTISDAVKADSVTIVIATDAITATEIAANAVANSEMADNAIREAEMNWAQMNGDSIVTAANTRTNTKFSIAAGGTNSSTGLNNNRIMVSSGAAIVEAGAMGNGQVLIGSTSAAPVVAALTGTSNEVTVTNGAGSITLSAASAIKGWTDGGTTVSMTTTGDSAFIGTTNPHEAKFYVNGDIENSASVRASSFVHVSSVDKDFALADLEAYDAKASLLLTNSNKEKTYRTNIVTLDTSFIILGFDNTADENPVIQMYNAAGKYTYINQGANTMNWQFTLPPDDGIANQFLQTDGSGVTSWVTAATDANTLTFTNKTFDAAATGNTFTEIEELPINILLWDRHSTTLDSGVVGANSKKFAFFFDASTDEAIRITFKTPSYISASTSFAFQFMWYSATQISGGVRWALQESDAGYTENFDPVLSADVATTSFAIDPANLLNSVQITISSPGWSGNELVTLVFRRDADHAGDTMTGDAVLVSINGQVTVTK